MEVTGEEAPLDDLTGSKASKFRFKSKRARSDEDVAHDQKKRHRGSYEDDEHSRTHRHRHRRRHRSSRRKERHSGPRDDPSAYDDMYNANHRSSQYVDPDAAFRESLFDALADDEGAAYWEGVYGQPVHVYPNARPGPEGELERMSDEEYAEYVRGRMWEKSHQHIIEERARRDKDRARRKKEREQTEQMEAESEEFQQKVQESLKRGEERKAKRLWKESWEKYVKRWEDLRSSTGEPNTDVKGIIPWPVQSSKYSDVKKEEIEAFFRHASAGEIGLAGLLKAERVKWHPDKIQQRFGERIDADTVKSVTAVFQVIDRLWNDVRQRR